MGSDLVLLLSSFVQYIHDAYNRLIHWNLICSVPSSILHVRSILYFLPFARLLISPFLIAQTHKGCHTKQASDHTLGDYESFGHFCDITLGLEDMSLRCKSRHIACPCLKIIEGPVHPVVHILTSNRVGLEVCGEAVRAETECHIAEASHDDEGGPDNHPERVESD